jgi:hypothetical protein
LRPLVIPLSDLDHVMNRIPHHGTLPQFLNRLHWMEKTDLSALQTSVTRAANDAESHGSGFISAMSGIMEARLTRRPAISFGEAKHLSV